MFRNIDQNADNVYLNVSMVNSVFNQASAAGQYSATYNEPILDRPSNYYCAVVKFEIPLQALPLLVFPDPLDTDATWTVGVCEVNRTTTSPSYDEDVIYVNENGFNTTSDFAYYYVYSYQHLAEMINNSLRASWIAAGSPGGVAPYIIYKSEGVFEFILDNAFINAATTTPGSTGWTVYWNNRFQTIFPGWHLYLNPTAPSRYELITDQITYDDSFKTLPPFPVTTFKFAQDYNMIDYVNSVRKILITSSTLPIRKEYYPPPIEDNNPGASNTIPILSEFQLDLNSSPGAQRTVAVYEANELRFIDMISDTPLSRIDLALFWADRNNNLRRLQLSKNDIASIKLGFFSKSMYKGNPSSEKGI